MREGMDRDVEATQVVGGGVAHRTPLAKSVEYSHGKMGKWKDTGSSLGAAVVGGVVGVGGGLLASSVLTEAAAAEVVPEVENVEELPDQESVSAATREEHLSVYDESVVYEHAPVASGVNDGMSFDEAFATARAETGPGGVFHWHGGIYGTYYKTEWDNMSSYAKSEFADSWQTHEGVSAEYDNGSEMALEDGESSGVLVDEDGDGIADNLLLDSDGDGVITASDAQVDVSDRDIRLESTDEVLILEPGDEPVCAMADDGGCVWDDLLSSLFGDDASGVDSHLI